MFKEPKYISSSLTIIFDKQRDIRRKLFDFEEALKDVYSQPDVISVPDDLDPEVPRMIFTSKNGNSQILVTQLNIALNVKYSPDDWQKDISKGKEYLEKKIPILFNLLQKISPELKANYCGLNTNVQLASSASDKEILNEIIKKYFNQSLNDSALFELGLKIVKLIDNQFFSNIEILGYKTWEKETIRKTRKLNTKDATEKGLAINIDYNDKYAYNHQSNYFSNESKLQTILNNAFIELERELKNARS